MGNDLNIDLSLGKNRKTSQKHTCSICHKLTDKNRKFTPHAETFTEFTFSLINKISKKKQQQQQQQEYNDP